MYLDDDDEELELELSALLPLLSLGLVVFFIGFFSSFMATASSPKSNRRLLEFLLGSGFFDAGFFFGTSFTLSSLLSLEELLSDPLLLLLPELLLEDEDSVSE